MEFFIIYPYMKFYRKLKILLFLLLPLLSLAHGDDEYGCRVKDPKGKYREHNVDFLTMKLEVDFDLKNSGVNGNVLYTFNPKQFKVDTLFLDAPGIQVFTPIKMVWWFSSTKHFRGAKPIH
jgi:hypothetical protein